MDLPALDMRLCAGSGSECRAHLLGSCENDQIVIEVSNFAHSPRSGSDRLDPTSQVNRIAKGCDDDKNRRCGATQDSVG